MENTVSVDKTPSQTPRFNLKGFEAKGSGVSIVIMAPSVTHHDAVSQDILHSKEALEDCGFIVHVYAEHHYADQLPYQPIDRERVGQILKEPHALVIYHHALAWELGEKLLDRFQPQTILRYHNISPPKFFRGYDDTSYYATKAGEMQTTRLIGKSYVRSYLVNSPFSGQNLEELGAPHDAIKVLPPFHNIDEWPDRPDDLSTKEWLEDSKPAFLFVGRLLPHKGIHHLIKALSAYLDAYGDPATLQIVGKVCLFDPTYYKSLEKLISKLRLKDFVTFHQEVSREQLATFYRYSQAFLLCSEHEGFCVPILEAQRFGLPIIALDRGAVKDTLGPGQITLKEPHPKQLAAAMKQCLGNPATRTSLIECGKKNFQSYSYSALKSQLVHFIDEYITLSREE